MSDSNLHDNELSVGFSLLKGMGGVPPLVKNLLISPPPPPRKIPPSRLPPPPPPPNFYSLPPKVNSPLPLSNNFQVITQ